MRGPNGLAFSTAATAFVAMFWAGMLAGVSFLATPVKFQAVSLSLPVALEVGRVTFSTFSRIEWGLALILAMTALINGSRYLLMGTALAVSIVVVEALWLLPVLDARVESVIAGRALSPSSHHMLYAVADATKLLLLWAVSLRALYCLKFAPLQYGARKRLHATHSSH